MTKVLTLSVLWWVQWYFGEVGHRKEAIINTYMHLSSSKGKILFITRFVLFIYFCTRTIFHFYIFIIMFISSTSCLLVISCKRFLVVSITQLLTEQPNKQRCDYKRLVLEKPEVQLLYGWIWKYFSQHNMVRNTHSVLISVGTVGCIGSKSTKTKDLL